MSKCICRPDVVVDVWVVWSKGDEEGYASPSFIGRGEWEREVCPWSRPWISSLIRIGPSLASCLCPATLFGSTQQGIYLGFVSSAGLTR